MYRRKAGGSGTVLGSVFTVTGTPAVGSIIRATSTTAGAWGPLDLADSDAVTGLLPIGNQNNQDMVGDVGGTTGNNTVNRLRGVTIKSANGATTGPVNSVLSLTSTAASPDECDWGLIVNANIDAGAAIAGTKISPDFGSQNITTTGYHTAGGTIASAGSMWRLASASNSMAMRNAANSADVYILDTDGTNNRVYFGGTNGQASLPTNTYLFGTTSNIGSSTTVKLKIDTTAVQPGLPIVGFATVFGVHGSVTHNFTVNATYVLLNTQYIYGTVIFTDSGVVLSGATTTTWPHPASDAAGYEKLIINSTAQTLTISTGTGTTKTLVAGEGRRFRFAAAGVGFAGTNFTL